MSQSGAEQNAVQIATEHAKAGQYQEALYVIEKAGKDIDNNAEMLYVSAVCLRKLKHHQEAIKRLKKVLDLSPDFVRAHQELGHTFLAENNLSSAKKSYETALEMDNALLASWQALVTIYGNLGDSAALKNAQHQAQQLQQLPPALQAVKSHLNRNNINEADEICRHYLQQHKQDVEAMRLLASIAVKVKVFDDAEFILESAVTFEPGHLGARYDYAHVLLKRQKFGKAQEVAKALIKEKPSVPQFQLLLAATTTGVGDTVTGIEMYQKIIDQTGDSFQYLLLGHAQKTSGDLQGAIASYRTLYQNNPSFGDAFWSLANTKTYQFTDDEIRHMQDYAVHESTSLLDRVHFNFALGKAFEDKGDYDAAFHAYNNGNELNKESVKYSVEETSQRVDNHILRCDVALFERLNEFGCHDTAPIFIVGLPRAGSTLLEQILASHSQVDGTLELPNVISLVHRLQGRDLVRVGEENRYPKILAELEPELFARFGQQYIDETRIFRQGASRFIDKMPNNFLHIGLIRLMLPNAKVIDARRHPMSCCFSGFKQLFAEGQDFTYGLEEIGNYYKDYVRLMDHWDEVLPGFVLRVQHEDVVNDLETQVRRILDFCGLEFEESCLEFYKTERNVRTPSSEQVRQPIYKSGLEQWRNFESHLGPLVEALGEDVLRRYPFEPAV